MKRISSLPVPVLVALLALAIAIPASAQSANGSFQFQFDNSTKTIEFNVKKQGNGAKGSMTYTGVTSFADQDVDGSGDSGPAGTVNVSLKVDFDCLVQNGNKAAASGLVVESSVPGLVGRRGLLYIEDNGEGVNQPSPDRFTWGLYRQNDTGWVPSDAELMVDTGVGLTWLADDAERTPGDDDNPVVSSVPPAPGDCQGFTLGSYVPTDLPHGNGNIQVKP